MSQDLWDDAKSCPIDFSALFSSCLNKNRLSRLNHLKNTLIQLQAQQEVGFSVALPGRVAVTWAELFVKMHNGVFIAQSQKNI